MTTNRHISALPEELLYDILQCVRDSSSTNPLVHCLLVNRLFNRISTPLFYQSIFLHNSTLKSSVLSLKAHKDQIHSLKIRIKPCEVETYTPPGQPDHVRVLGESREDLEHYGSKATRALFEVLDAFSMETLPYLKNLSTFSMTVEAPAKSTFSLVIEPPLEVLAAVPGFWIHSGVANMVLESLASSVENIELDLGEYQFPGNHVDEHDRCALLRERLPRLRNLRLRLGSLCPALFYEGDEDDSYYGDDSDDAQTPVTAPHLETLVMNMDLGQGYSTSACSRGDPDDGHYWVSHKIRDPEDPQWWLNICKKAVQTDAFPKLQQLDVLGLNLP